MADYYGTASNDTITGSSDADEIFGYAGDDTLNGGAGDDLLSGGAGDDMIDGGDGDDLLYGDEGDDQLTGGAGTDVAMMGGWPSDFTIVLREDGAYVVTDRQGYWGTDILVGVEQLDFAGYRFDLADLVAPGTAGGDYVVGGDGMDWLFGLGGDDLLRGGAGMNLIDGGDGDDTAVYAGASSDYHIYLNPEGLVEVDRVAADGEDAFLLGADVLISVEHLHFEGDQTILDVTDIPALGTAGDDVLVGSARNDVLFGFDGDDTLDGGAGADILSGGAGNDLYVGGAGDDTIYDNEGGDDVFHYDPGDGNDTVRDEGGGHDVLDFGAGIDPSQVIVSLDDWGSGYTFTFADQAGSVTVRGAASGNDAFTLDEVHFADGTVWTAGQLHDFAGLGG